MNPNDPIIKTEEEARAAVYSWCIKEKLEPARFTDITAEIAKSLTSGPISESALTSYIAHFVIATKQSEEVWGKYASTAWTAASNWAIEAVKHLAFVNGAGLAGATAILSSSKEFSGHWLIAATVLLGIGLILSVLCMWIEGRGFQERAKNLDGRAFAVKNATTWKAYADAQGEIYKDAGASWFKASFFSGWSSAAMALLGISCIVIAVA